MKEHIGSIILEHLSNKLNIHVLNVDLLVQGGTCISTRLNQTKLAARPSVSYAYLQTSIENRNRLVQLFLERCLSKTLGRSRLPSITYDIGDDTHEKQALLMLVGAFLS